MSEKGRPLLFKSVKKLEKAIEEYFKSCWQIKYDREGVALVNPESIENTDVDEYQRNQIKPYTIEGLASYLKTSRQTLINYEKREEFFDTICEAKERIQAYQAERLFDRDGVNGAKFSLINNYKRDKYEDSRSIDHTSNGKELENLTQSERQAKIAQLQSAIDVTDG